MRSAGLTEGPYIFCPLSNCQAEAVVMLNKAAAFLDPFNDVFRTSLPPDLMSTVNVFMTNKSVLIKQQ